MLELGLSNALSWQAFILEVAFLFFLCVTGWVFWSYLRVAWREMWEE